MRCPITFQVLRHRLFTVIGRPILLAPPDGLIDCETVALAENVEEFVKMSQSYINPATIHNSPALISSIIACLYPFIPLITGVPSRFLCASLCAFFNWKFIFLKSTAVLCLTSHSRFFSTNIQGQDKSRRNPPDCTFIMSRWQVPWRTGRLSAHESARAEGGWDRRDSHLLTGIIMQRWFANWGGWRGGGGAKEKIIEFTSEEEDERFNQNSSAQVGVIEFARKYSCEQRLRRDK